MNYLSSKRICVTGGAGFLGRAVCAELAKHDIAELFVPRSHEYDLIEPVNAHRLLIQSRSDIIIHLAAEVGGIAANQQQPGRFFYANIMIGLNLIEAARIHGIEKFIQIGTVCSYPKHCELPFCEDDLWNGYPEETNAPYGIAKRAFSIMLDAYRRQYGFNGIYLIPTNLYGPGDNFDSETSHVIPALIWKFCEAVDNGIDTVTCWGSGTPTREFLYIDDAAEAIVKAAAIHNDSQPINLGSHCEITIADLAGLVAKFCGYSGEIIWDNTRPDGQPHRSIDVSRAARVLNWHSNVHLEEGLQRTIAWWRGQNTTT